jgi:DNA-binding LacI/PurR family transcriptional regulator
VPGSAGGDCGASAGLEGRESLADAVVSGEGEGGRLAVAASTVDGSLGEGCGAGAHCAAARTDAPTPLHVKNLFPAPTTMGYFDMPLAMSQIARPRIGFLVRALDEFQAPVVLAARNAALARDMSFFCFVGGELGSEPERNRIYHLVGRNNVDALAIMGGTIGNHVGLDALSRFCARFGDLPMCSIGVQLPGMSSVEIDNREGLRAGIRHLVRAHGRRRLAFICGPEKNEEAQERYQAYRDSLDEHGIEFDPKLVVPGNFTIAGGSDIIRALFRERRLAESIDAIVAANDATAFGVLKELSALRISVPGRISVIGFDDIEDARYATTPLTTVRQPLREQGEAAIRVLSENLRGQQENTRLVLPTGLVLRRSCGCAAGAAPDTVRRDSILPGSPSAPSSFESSLLRRRDLVRAELARAARGSFVGLSDWENLLISTFADQLRSGSDRFSRAVEDLFEHLIAADTDLAMAQDVLTVFRDQMLVSVGQDWPLRARAEDHFHFVNRIAAASAERVQAARRSRAERTAYAVSLACRNLAAVSTVVELADVVGWTFPQFGILRCCVSLFATAYEPGDRARLLFVHDDTQSQVEIGEPFLSSQLTPPEVLDPRNPRAYVVMCLYFDHRELGIMVAAYDDAPYYVYETGSELLAAAVIQVEIPPS